MTDKRAFHVLLNRLKDTHPSAISIIESIQTEFDVTFEPITDVQKRALRNFPEQYLKRIYNEDKEWTTQLHIWAEQGVPEILKLDPMILAFQNSLGDSVLMCLIAGATGAYTEKIDYDLIKSILNTKFDYIDIEKDQNGNDIQIEKNALDVIDINDQTPIDYLIDFAYATGRYEGYEPDDTLINQLNEFVEVMEASEAEEPNEPEEITEEVISEPESEEEIEDSSDEQSIEREDEQDISDNEEDSEEYPEESMEEDYSEDSLDDGYLEPEDDDDYEECDEEDECDEEEMTYRPYYDNRRSYTPRKWF